MYSEETIVSLSKRIGFGAPLENGFPFTIEEANSTGSTDRLFSSFHSLVTVENIYAATPISGGNADEKFNEALHELRNNATLAVLPLIMDKNEQYQTTVNYDSIMLDNANLFDDAIGYKVAMMALELFISTKESNLAERNAKMALSNLKVELYGYKNDYGHTVATGLTHLFSDAIIKASKKIFPVVPTVSSKKIW